jgi:NADH-quinone oxidoreductase subunit H
VVSLEWWIEIAVKILVVFLLLLTAVAYTVLLERRVLAHIQSRIGPNRVGPQGLLQPVADALKLMSKETVVPHAADRVMFLLAPVFAMVPGLVAFSVIPFGESLHILGRDVTLQITDVNVAALLILALSSIGVYGAFLGGWSSNNKFALMGALRSSSQMISYEVTMGLVVVTVVLLASSFSLRQIVEAQREYWFILLQPVGFALFIVAALAELNRTPFDLPEAEPELVAGYHSEYSGMRFAMYMLGEYVGVFTMTSLAVLLFLGGWLVPWPSPVWMGPVWFAVKVMIIVFFMMWTRGTLPRFRYDQLMKFGWKFMLPLALANLVVTALVVVLLES